MAEGLQPRRRRAVSLPGVAERAPTDDDPARLAPVDHLDQGGMDVRDLHRVPYARPPAARTSRDAQDGNAEPHREREDATHRQDQAEIRSHPNAVSLRGSASA
jgi:hypothetical protein